MEKREEGRTRLESFYSDCLHSCVVCSISVPVAGLRDVNALGAALLPNLYLVQTSHLCVWCKARSHPVHSSRRWWASLTCKLQWAGPSGGGREGRVLATAQECGGQRRCWVGLTPGLRNDLQPSVQTFAPLHLPSALLCLCLSASMCGIWDQKHVCTLHRWYVKWYSGSLVLCGGDKTFPPSHLNLTLRLTAVSMREFEAASLATVTYTQICFDCV